MYVYIRVLSGRISYFCAEGAVGQQKLKQPKSSPSYYLNLLVVRGEGSNKVVAGFVVFLAEFEVVESVHSWVNQVEPEWRA